MKQHTHTHTHTHTPVGHRRSMASEQLLNALSAQGDCRNCALTRPVRVSKVCEHNVEGEACIHTRVNRGIQVESLQRNRDMHTHTRTHACMHAHTYTHAHAHTHTHRCTLKISFLVSQTQL